MEGRLILLRHGASVWNKKNLFTGWVDIPLSPEGIEEALNAGRLLARYPIDAMFTSTLIRAQMTAMLAMLHHPSEKIAYIVHPGRGRLRRQSQVTDPQVLQQLIPVHVAWQLNERFYGDLQGMNKDAMRQQFGTEQVQLWRRSFAVAPPHGESLQMTRNRTLPYCRKQIFPLVKEGKTVVVAAHGNSLRSIVMELDHLSEEEVIALEIPTGAIVSYTWSREKQWSRCAS